MRYTVRILCKAIVLISVGPSIGASEPIDFQEAVLPLMEKYCFDCHGQGAEEGGIALDKLAGLDAFEGPVESAGHHDDSLASWLAVWKNLRTQLMPPSSADSPTEAERERMIRWIEQDVFHLDPEHPDPGRATIRRLNRVEYRNTIRDLYGIDFDTIEMFPADDSGYGFDNISDVLSISPLLMEKYMDAAQVIADQVVPSHGIGQWALADGPPPTDPDARWDYAANILGRQAERAFRRSVDDATLMRLVELAKFGCQKEDHSFEAGIRHALVAILTSPRFLFRAENQPESGQSGRIVAVDEFSLASSLSYFLWSSCPDDELLTLAGEGKLRANLRAQVDRLIAHPKGEALAANFVGQWLRTRDVVSININASRVLRVRADKANQIFNRRLRKAMQQETELLFQHLLREQLPATELLTARYSFLNRQLADFYGIEGVRGREMRKVDFPETCDRMGILTHGSFLVVTSNPTRTSPVKRGQFILENLLGSPAPPAPANIPDLEASARHNRQLSMRERMELHRKDPLCASCHARMDPLGLAMETFNAVGKRRETGEAEINTAGELITGETFQDSRSLATVLATARRRDFHRCLAEKMLTYALGRGVEYHDALTIDKMVNKMEESGGSLRELVYQVVESVPFQKRRVLEVEAKTGRRGVMIRRPEQGASATQFRHYIIAESNIAGTALPLVPAYYAP